MNTKPDAIERFLTGSRFAEKGALVLDLDNTALHEDRGKITIPPSVREGVKAMFGLGRPIVLNTLRFPLSVMRTIGHEWFDITHHPIPAVFLNGSVLGHIHRTSLGIFTYEELEAFPLSESEIGDALGRVRRLVDGGLDDLLVFYYPRDWIRGEYIWTPDPGDIRDVSRKYISSTTVFTTDIEDLKDRMLYEEACMIFVLANYERDRLMAYQHTDRASYFTRAGVDKLSGMTRIMERLGVSPEDSIGAGDSGIDNFLEGVGLALRVGGRCGHEGRRGTVDLESAHDLGGALLKTAELIGRKNVNLTDYSSAERIVEKSDINK